MPPVTRRGYNNEFKHEVKSVSMPLQGHRPGVFISTPREGRPPRRPPQCRCRSTAFHLSSLCASARAKALYGALIPRGRDDLRPVRLNTSSRQQLSGLLSSPLGFSPVRLNTSSRQQLSGLLSSPSGFSPVRLNASTPQQLSGLLSPPSGFSPVSPVRLNALTLAPCLRASV